VGLIGALRRLLGGARNGDGEAEGSSDEPSAIERELGARFAPLAGATLALRAEGEVVLEEEGRVLAAASSRTHGLLDGWNTENVYLGRRGARTVLALSQGNEKATRTALAGMIAFTHLRAALEAEGDFLDGCRQAIDATQAELAALTEANPELATWSFPNAFTRDVSLRGLATSLTAIALEGGRARVLHVGETSAWAVGAEGARRLSADHTKTMARISGDPTADDTMPIVLAFLGDAPPPMFHDETILVAEGEVLVLASSLVTERLLELPPEAIARGLRDAEPVAACAWLVEQARPHALGVTSAVIARGL